MRLNQLATMPPFLKEHLHSQIGLCLNLRSTSQCESPRLAEFRMIPFYTRHSIPLSSKKARTVVGILFAIGLFVGFLTQSLKGDTFGLFTYSVYASSVTITDYPTNATGAVAIPSTIAGMAVIRIGDSAFSGCSGLTSVTIPSTVTDISNSAFSECSGLTSVTIPSSVGSIGNYAYYRCTGLTAIDIPFGVTSIGTGAFSACSALSRATIPSTVQFIWDYAFSDCHGLTEVNISAGVLGIQNHAFSNCPKLSSISIPPGVRGIGDNAFHGCFALTNLNIPSSVTNIGASAFSACTSLTSVVIPSGVPFIRDYTFSGCYNLTSITFPASTSTISANAFEFCQSLVAANFLGNAPLIQGNAFGGTAAGFTIHFIAGKTGFSTLTWSSVDDLMATVIAVEQPSGTGIRNGLSRDFSNVDIGTEKTLTFKIKNIGNLDLTNLTITKEGTSEFEITANPLTPVSGGSETTFNVRFAPTGLGTRSARLSIANNDLTGNPFYIDISGTGTVTGTYGPLTYQDIGTSITIASCSAGATGEVTIPSTIEGKPVTRIGNQAFENQSELTSVVIPTSVTKIGSYAFSSCSGLTSVLIPASVTTIENYAFSGCSGLTSISLPASITSIGTYAFYNCSSLKSANFLGNAPTLGTAAFNGTAAGFTIHFITGRTGFTIPTWGRYPSTDATISVQLFHSSEIAKGDTYAFSSQIVGFPLVQNFTIKNSGNSSMTGIAVTVSGANSSDFTVSTAPAASVSGGGGQTYFTVQFTPTEEGSRTAVLSIASSDSTANPFEIMLTGTGTPTTTFGMFKYVVNGASITIVGHVPNPLGVATIPAGIAGKPVTTIWSKAFQNCTGLTGVTIPSGVTIIQSSAFAGCSNLASASIPPTLTTLGDSAFSGCTNLTSATIPAGITNFGTSVFSGCSGLTSVTLSNGLASMGSSLFAGCTSLSNVSIPPSLAYISSSAFSGCTGLNSVTIPSTVTSISSFAFSGCTGLTALTIPSSVTSVGGSTFSGCSGLTTVTIPASITFIGSRGFENCSNLKSVIFMGNAPSMTPDAYTALPNEFSSYFHNGATGFTTPIWKGYNAVNMGAISPVKPWLIAHGYTFDADLQSDPNGDGVNLLTAYALNLNPNLNLIANLPRPFVTGGQMSITFYGNRQGVTYSVETSIDLKTWSPIGVSVSTPNTNGFRTGTVDSTQPSKFMRLVFTY